MSGGRPALLKSYWVKPTPLIPGQDKRERGAREDDVTVTGRDLRLLWALRPLRVLTEGRSVGDAVAMTICQFFLQGRCRFGDRCWNEHPGAGGAGGGRQQQPSGDVLLYPPRLVEQGKAWRQRRPAENRRPAWGPPLGTARRRTRQVTLTCPRRPFFGPAHRARLRFSPLLLSAV